MQAQAAAISVVDAYGAYNNLSVFMLRATILSSMALQLPERTRWGRISQATAFAVGGLATPVRSEIGRYQVLAERATMLKHPGQSLVAATPLRRVRINAGS